MTTTYHYMRLPGTGDDGHGHDHSPGVFATGQSAQSLVIIDESGKPVEVVVPANVPTWQGEPMPEISKNEARKLAPDDVVSFVAGGKSLFDLVKDDNGNNGNNGKGKS